MKPSVAELVQKPNDEIIDLLGGIYEHSKWVAEQFVADEKARKDITTVRIGQGSQTDCGRFYIGTKIGIAQGPSRFGCQGRNLENIDKRKSRRTGWCRIANHDSRRTGTVPFEERSQTYRAECALEGRLEHSKEVELAAALVQVHKIAWMRWLALVIRPTVLDT
eukprot:scaffold2983_cov123-Cylindrotheca_fusiformis.AAC.3